MTTEVKVSRELAALITQDAISKIVAGLPPSYDSLRDKKGAVMCALHCILNGPVSVHKSTKFPEVGDAKIEDVCGVKLSNGGWRSFCRIIAEYVKKTFGSLQCSSINKNGDYWPLKPWN